MYWRLEPYVLSSACVGSPTVSSVSSRRSFAAAAAVAPPSTSRGRPALMHRVAASNT